MFSRFFVNRPIFASVISILILIAGGVTIFQLPVARYPDISPPMVQVQTFYPGADPKVIADTVASPIEQEVNGVENMLYMGSRSSSNGQYQLRITFELGTDIDMATVLVQNRVATAMPKLPLDVQRQGVVTKKASTSFVSVISFYTPDGRYDDLFLTNYLNLFVKDRVARVKGVGDVFIFPMKDYSMRIWLDPNKMESRSLTVEDVTAALQNQNVQVAAGQIGQPPAPKETQFQLTINTLGRLTEPEEFLDIIIKTGEGGRITRIRDVARVELGGKTYDSFAKLNGLPSATPIVFQTPESNALDVADSVRAALAEMKPDFPAGLQFATVYDASDFVRASIDEVIKTLVEAFILVSLVVFIFLQDWRTTLIPMITIPISIIGTFAVMALFGFSINMLTLFGLVLAIGIVVDDAIVVVENVERNMREHGLHGKEAAIQAMNEVTNPIVATSLVLIVVFLPAAFLGGIVGQLYRQFCLTIAATTFFSAVNALTLSPALCALLLRPHRPTRNPFFKAFNWVFGGVTRAYTGTVRLFVRRAAIAALLFVAVLGLTGFTVGQVPFGFLPLEDDGLLLVNTQLPDGASLQRTEKVLMQVSDVLKNTDGVDYYSLLGGFSLIAGNGSNLGFTFASLEPWDKRLPQGRTKDAIWAELSAKLAQIKEADVRVFPLPPIPGLGSSGGLEMQVQDRAVGNLTALQNAADEMRQRIADREKLASMVFSTFRANVPTLFVDVDRVKAFTTGVPLNRVFDAMQAYLGSSYVNDFNKFGRTWQVMVQADSRFRSSSENIRRLEVRNNDGNMVPLGTIATVQETTGPPSIDRYNMYPAAMISAIPAVGASTGNLMAAMENLGKTTLPQGMGYEWTSIAYEQKKTGAQSGFIFLLGMIVVFLILAAQYESWSDPFGVILIVPLAVLGAAAALLARAMDNNLYTQVGLVLLIALAAKNAILIVEFARVRRDQGLSLQEAAVEASRLRFRPILMTSFTFILGVLPLTLATGAGAVGRQTLGTAVAGGMLGATVLGVVFTPTLFVVIRRSVNWFRRVIGRPEQARTSPLA